METARLALLGLFACLVVYTAGRITSELLTSIVSWLLNKIWPEPKP